LISLGALHLFGLFEVNLGGQVMGAAGDLASKHGAMGAFFNGVLATVLATPCTAPFLSVALGFAFAQPAGITMLVFLTVGLGLAFPYVLLSFEPRWLKFLPKPGAWMERFKIAMGFPMLATALWLFSLLATHYGQRSWWLGIFLVIVALAAWVFGEFVQRGRTGRAAGAIVALALLIVGYTAVVEGKLQWRSPELADVSKPTGGTHPSGIAWQVWSPEAVASARAEGRPVLIDFTAEWCLTCNAIVKPALEDASVRRKIEQTKAIPLIGDYTRFPENISEELTKFQSAGVPLVVVYPKDPNEPPIVLPQPSPLRGPSHYRKIILEALDQAAPPPQAMNSAGN
jgi:thiol:disulfide interchange protein